MAVCESLERALKESISYVLERFDGVEKLRYSWRLICSILTPIKSIVSEPVFKIQTSF